MLSVEQIQEVKQEFIDLLSSIKREGSDIDGLISYLEEIGFFKAPASAKYHCSFPGGLCLHSINVYKALVNLTDTFASHLEFHESEDGKMASEDLVTNYSKDTLLIVGLLHDVIRANLFEEYSKNEKVYSEYGKKKETYIDPVTNKEVNKYFDWQTVTSFKVRDAEERMTFGSRGFSSYYIISQFLPLSNEETVTLVNQYSAFDNSNSEDISSILSKYNLSVYLHAADTIATYCIEK